MVNKGEDQEQTLYAKVRNAEYSRQKQEQNVRRIQQQLQEVKRRNAAQVKKELAAVTKQEQELEQQLYREKAELDKVGLGPVVQSIVSLTSSLRGQLVKCFTTL